MIHASKDRFSQGQKEIFAVVTRIDAANIFGSDTPVRRRQFNFSRDRSLPYLGRHGLVETVENFGIYNNTSCLLDGDETEGSVTISRHLQPMRGCADGIDVVSRYVLTEWVDGRGVGMVDINPLTLVVGGCREEFTIFSRSNPVARYDHDVAIAEANRMLDVFTGAIPTITGDVVV